MVSYDCWLQYTLPELYLDILFLWLLSHHITGCSPRRRHRALHGCVAKKERMPFWPLSVAPLRLDPEVWWMTGSVRVKPSTAFHTPCRPQKAKKNDGTRVWIREAGCAKQKQNKM